MKKGEWYRFLFSQIDYAIKEKYFFEASFICYGIIEDRLNSLMNKNSLPIGHKGVAAKIKALAKNRNNKAETVLMFKNWDGGKYKDKGLLKDCLAWGELYRNPMQHTLGDPRDYKANVGHFHNEVTEQLAIEGRRVARELAALVMRYKK